MVLEDLNKHESNSTRHHLKLALDNVQQQQRLISTLQATVNLQNQKFSAQEEQINLLIATQTRLVSNQNQILRTEGNNRERLNVIENQSDLMLLKDEHVWKISNFSQEVLKAKQLSTYTLTKTFYTSKGYKLKCVLYPHSTINQGVGIYYQTIEGNFDGNLSWPMEKNINVCVIDGENQRKAEGNFSTKGVNAFFKPPHVHIPCGYRQFIFENQIPALVSNDVLTIKFKIRDV